MENEVTGPERTFTQEAPLSTQWYVFHTFSGQEHKVKALLEKVIKAHGFENHVEQIVIPTEEVIEIKGGEKKIVPKKKYPGYILVKMELSEDLWRAMKSTSGINYYFSEGGKPIPLSEQEAKQILSSMEEGAKPRLKTTFEKGDSIQVLYGPFSSFTGTIQEIREDRGKIKALLSIFGRETPVELDFEQVKKT